MPAETENMRRCITCKASLTLEQFTLNKKGEHHKTCNTCCIKKKEYNETNKEAIAKRYQEYRERNKEVISQKNKEYKQQNMEQIAERRKEYREKNKELLAARRKEHFEANKDLLREKRREYNEKNPDKVYEWKERELARRKVICECGASYSKYTALVHPLNRRHVEWLASNGGGDIEELRSAYRELHKDALAKFIRPSKLEERRLAIRKQAQAKP